MTKSAFRSALEQLGLTQGQAAKELGYHIRTIANWANGHERIPLSVEKLLKCWLKYGLNQ